MHRQCFEISINISWNPTTSQPLTDLSLQFWSQVLSALNVWSPEKANLLLMTMRLCFINDILRASCENLEFRHQPSTYTMKAAKSAHMFMIQCLVAGIKVWGSWGVFEHTWQSVGCHESGRRRCGQRDLHTSHERTKSSPQGLTRKGELSPSTPFCHAFSTSQTLMPISQICLRIVLRFFEMSHGQLPS